MRLPRLPVLMNLKEGYNEALADTSDYRGISYINGWPCAAVLLLDWQLRSPVLD